MHLINNVFKKINQSSCQVYLGLNKFHSRLCNFCIGAIFLYITLPCRLGEFFLWFWQLYVVFCRFASFLSIHNLPLPIHVWSFPHFQRPSHHTSSIVRTFRLFSQTLLKPSSVIVSSIHNPFKVWTMSRNLVWMMHCKQRSDCDKEQNISCFLDRLLFFLTEFFFFVDACVVTFSLINFLPC